MQHLWAELSEKLADIVDPAIKYGAGPEKVRSLLAQYSDIVKQIEDLELMPYDRKQLDELKQKIRQLLENTITEVSKLRFEN